MQLILCKALNDILSASKARVDDSILLRTWYIVYRSGSDARTSSWAGNDWSVVNDQLPLVVDSQRTSERTPEAAVDRTATDNIPSVFNKTSITTSLFELICIHASAPMGAWPSRIERSFTHPTWALAQQQQRRWRPRKRKRTEPCESYCC